MEGSEGAWHETLVSESTFEGSSDRAFGIWFSAVCAVLGALGLWQGRSSARYWIGAAAVFLIGAIFFAPLLGPLNRLWQKLSLMLNRIVTPVIMSIMFYVVITPIALLMRLFGKDPLQLRLDTNARSYWIDQTAVKPTSMKKAF